MADAPQLRWVKYGEVSYPALLWTDGQPPVEVPQDHVFVIFLGDNSGAAVPLADVSPYDANDVAKTSHPDVAAGVAEAAAIIRGSAVGGADDDGGDVPSSKKTKKVKKERRDEDEEVSTSRRHKRNHEDDEEDALLGVGTLSKPKPADISDSDVDSDDDDDDSEEDWGGDVERLYRQSHNNNNNINGLRTGDGPIARRGARGATFGGATAHMMMMKSSPVAPYLHELRFCYARRREEANVGKKAISCQELDVIRAAEQHLYGQQCGAHLLRRQSELSSTSEAREMLRDMADQLQRAPLQVDLLVASTAQLRVAPTDAPRGRHRHLRPAGEGGDDDQDEISTLHSFVDPIVHNTIRTITSNLAPPRELTHDLANRLREQRLHRERVLNAHRGLLNKTGLVAAPRTLEKWRQARELMMVAPVVETQDVLPTGFISRRHAEVAARVEAHAMRRLQKGIRGGAPPTSNNNTNNNVSSASGVGVSGFTPGSIAEMVATYQSTGGISARRAKPSTPAYYNFHELSIDQQHRNTATRNGGVAGGASLAAGFLDDLHEGPASAAMLDGPSDTFLANNNNNNINALVPPLTLGFDARAVFHADGGREDPHLVGKSLLYSTSIGLPSQESVWCSVMDGTGDEGQTASNNNNTTKRAAPSRRSGRHLSTSRASSLASSIAYSDGGSRAGGDDDAHARGGWREAAKKAIIRQLSHYTRPREDGKPPVLDAADFKHIAKSLLERAVRTEAERSGLSMALRINNEHATFTKEVEWALRKSVDGYVRRHYLRPEGDADGSEDEEGSLMRRHHHQQQQQQQRTHASSKVAAEGLSSVAPASAIPSVLPHGAEDSPLYE